LKRVAAKSANGDKETTHAWYVDSGATSHMTPHKYLVSDFVEESNATITMDDKQQQNVEGHGMIELMFEDRKSAILKEVLCISNLVS